MPQKSISLMSPYITPQMRAAAAAVLETRWIGQGPKVDEFERAFSERVVNGAPCVAVGSCTDALHLAYVLAGIGEGDEVLAPIFTCTATNIPLLYCGARIRWCDVEEGRLNVGPWQVASMITERTKAVVVVHYGGEPVDLTPILDHPSKPVVIEDCAQSLGAAHGRRGHYQCYSFQAVKHITTADGGMLVCPPDKYEEAKRRRWFGIDRKAKQAGTWANDITEVGYKYQMTDIGAAMGLAGLDTLNMQLQYRAFLRERYVQGMLPAGVRAIDDNMNSAMWLMTVAVDRREYLIRKLAEHGIEAAPAHYRNDRYSVFAQFSKHRDPEYAATFLNGSPYPNMDAIEPRYLCLPFHPGVTMEDVDRICAVIREGW